MEKEFIPYEIALAIKELGFEEECFGEYFQIGHNFGQLVTSNEELDIELTSIFECGAPLYQQVFRWFREKYDLYGTIRYGYNEFDKSVFLFPCINGISGNDSFGKQEEAELECLKKLIEIVKE